MVSEKTSDRKIDFVRDNILFLEKFSSQMPISNLSRIIKYLSFFIAKDTGKLKIVFYEIIHGYPGSKFRKWSEYGKLKLKNPHRDHPSV